jgi:hypothetical protein
MMYVSTAAEQHRWNGDVVHGYGERSTRIKESPFLTVVSPV